MREFEAVIKDLANQGYVEGAVHCYTGEEAIALGVCLNLNDSDYIFSTHRGHGHAIAKGCDLKRIFAELMGKAKRTLPSRIVTRKLSNIFCVVDKANCFFLIINNSSEKHKEPTSSTVSLFLNYPFFNYYIILYRFCQCFWPER